MYGGGGVEKRWREEMRWDEERKAIRSRGFAFICRVRESDCCVRGNGDIPNDINQYTRSLLNQIESGPNIRVRAWVV